MGKENHNSLFNSIAPFYDLFFNRQRKRFAVVIKGAKEELDLSSYETILDVGCGTGALCSVLHETGLSVTGIDSAEKMLAAAMKKPENQGVHFIQANVLETLPFDDKCFDISIASYVAHGLKQSERKRMYAEMGRITKHQVVIYDYNKNRSFPTTVVEWLEKSDYLHFIKNAELEMKGCVSELKACFSEVKVIDVDTRAAWYICTPA